MADQVTYDHDLLIDTLFVDGDTRRITLKNPKQNIGVQEISALETLILNGGQSTLLVGDKTQAPFRRINKVTRQNKTTIDYDLTT